jgi:RNA polymerase sigma factor (sigma-70 family)
LRPKPRRLKSQHGLPSKHTLGARVHREAAAISKGFVLTELGSTIPLNARHRGSGEQDVASDRQLIKKNDVDDGSLNSLLEQFGGPVRRYLARHVRPSSDLDDVVQEVFVRLLGRADGRRIENVEGYVFQIAANLLRERGRRWSLRRNAAAIDLQPSLVAQDEEIGPERILLGREAYQRLIDGLNELPERTRTVFILNRFEDMTGVEIARRLGMSVSSVEKQMMRALAHLKRRVRG